MTTIYGRSSWGARYSAGFADAPLPADEVWLHHSVTSAPPLDATFDQDTAAVRVLEQIGQDRFGGGISYTFAIPPSGRIFEGHGVTRRGAHTAGRNSIARAICLVGNYDTARPSEAQVRAVALLLQHGARSGWWRRAFLNGGHRDAPGARTACPGRHGWDAIPAINRLASLPITPEDDMTPDQDARLTRIDNTLRFGAAGIRHAGEIAAVLARIVERLDAIEARLIQEAS